MAKAIRACIHLDRFGAIYSMVTSSSWNVFIFNWNFFFQMERIVLALFILKAPAPRVPKNQNSEVARRHPDVLGTEHNTQSFSGC